ncbi:MAG: metallophosphoesterase [Bacteroidota bacterium]
MKRVRRAVFLVHGYLILYPLLSLLGYFVDPEYVVRSIQGAYLGPDLLFAYPFWIGLISVLQLFPVLLISDLARFFFLRSFHSDKERWLLLQARILIPSVALIVGYVTVRVIIDTQQVRVSSRDYSVQGLPRALEGFRVVHFADLQMDSRTGPVKVNRYIDAVNALNPDIVCFSGDLVTWGPEYIDAAAEALGKIKSKYGVYATFGDHDYWAGPGYVDHALTKNGVRVLEDENFNTNFEGQSIVITAVTNVYQRRPAGRLLQTLASTRGPHGVSILLTHQPSPAIVKFAEGEGYDLFLAGHTHGGQVRLGYGSLTWTFSNVESPFVSGFFEIGAMLISVNNGLGLTFAPVRFQAPAEITLINLTARTRRQSPASTN